MDEKVREEYERILARVVIKHGYLVDEHASTYGWYASYDEHRHVRKCEVVRHGRVTESHWTEFAGTFAESDDRKTGVDLPGVTCVCGEITGRVVRLDAPVQKVAEYVFEELATEVSRLRGNLAVLTGTDSSEV